MIGQICKAAQGCKQREEELAASEPASVILRAATPVKCHGLVISIRDYRRVRPDVKCDMAFGECIYHLCSQSATQGFISSDPFAIRVKHSNTVQQGQHVPAERSRRSSESLLDLLPHRSLYIPLSTINNSKLRHPSRLLLAILLLVWFPLCPDLTLGRAVLGYRAQSRMRRCKQTHRDADDVLPQRCGGMKLGAASRAEAATEGLAGVCGGVLVGADAGGAGMEGVLLVIDIREYESLSGMTLTGRRKEVLLGSSPFLSLAEAVKVRKSTHRFQENARTMHNRATMSPARRQTVSLRCSARLSRFYRSEQV